MKKIDLATSKGSKVATYIYDDVQNPKAVIQIIHGASEFLLRYESFIDYLNRNNYIVIGCDNLGHGDSCHADANYIYFESTDAFEALVIVKEYIEKTYQELPIYLFGHSMGSFLARKLMIDYPKTYAKGIMSGTTSISFCVELLAGFLCFTAKVFRGPKGISPLLTKQGVPSFNKKMMKKAVLNEGEMWITHDENIVNEYKNSPKCGENFTITAMQGLLKWAKYVSSKKNVIKGDHSTPILFISGSDDPVSNFGKDIEKTVNLYKNCNYYFIESIIYNNMRHEVINEIDREKVYNDCVQFFDR